MTRWTRVVVVLAAMAAGIAMPAPAAGAVTPRVNVVGDSLTYRARQFQAAAFAAAGFPDVAIDAFEGKAIAADFSGSTRTGLEAVDALRASGGDTPTWVVALGTNDALRFPPGQFAGLIRQMLDRIGPGHTTMWVNIFLPQRPDLQSAWNQALAAVAAERPGEMRVYDWAAYAALYPEWMLADGLHHTVAGSQGRAYALADAAALVFGVAAPAVVPTVSAFGAPGRFTPLPPSRRFDSRVTGALAAGQFVRVSLLGVVPANATVVAVNLTAVEPDYDGFLTAYPCGGTRPIVSNVNVAAGAVAANFSLVPLDDWPSICVFTSMPTDAVVDVFGFFAPGVGAGLVAGDPRRLADTRQTGRLPGGGLLRVPVPGAGDAALVNLTVAAPRDDGFLTAFACGDPLPSTSNLNFTAGRVARANAAIVPVSAAGELCVFTNTAADVVVDLTGTFQRGGGDAFQAAAPVRLSDTRNGQGSFAGRVHTGHSIGVAVPAPATGVAVGNLTVVAPFAAGFATAWSGIGPVPLASNINAEEGEVIPNLVVAPLAGGAFRVHAGAGAGQHVVFDLQGWFA